MVHLAPCNKNINATDTRKLLWNTIVKLHGIPRAIYSDRGSQFVAGSWRELWRLIGTRLAYSTAYHPQTQGVVERMNSIVSQTVRCLLHDIGNPKDGEKTLPTVAGVPTGRSLARCPPAVAGMAARLGSNLKLLTPALRFHLQASSRRTHAYTTRSHRTPPVGVQSQGTHNQRVHTHRRRQQKLA